MSNRSKTTLSESSRSTSLHAELKLPLPVSECLALSGYGFYWFNLKALFGKRHFIGWGQKRTGRFAQWCAQRFNGRFTLLEDGFIRSLGLGVEGSPAMSLIYDDVGIYYDATRPSRLENLLNQTDFADQPGLLEQAEQAIALIRKQQLSKYNQTPLLMADNPDPSVASLMAKLIAVEDTDVSAQSTKGASTGSSTNTSTSKKILVIAQTAGDASLEYGYGNTFSTQELVQAAVRENPDAEIYLKIHPDVATGKKASDIDLEYAAKNTILIKEEINPVGLLSYFDKVYTKTSQMGFEALLLGKECICFGVPFYAGWGLTDDRVAVQRRGRRLTVTELFAAAYIFYPVYVNAYRHTGSNSASSLIETLHTLIHLRARALPPVDDAYFFGFSWWKKKLIRPFFTPAEIGRFHFINPLLQRRNPHTYLAKAVNKGLAESHSAQGKATSKAIFIWGRKAFPAVEAYALEHRIALYRIEDGFVRSVALGSDLTQPYSLVIDRAGIYFDPTQPSDLERLLQTYDFQAFPGLLKRAEQAQAYLVAQKLSKYNVYGYQRLNFPKNKKIILVPGQVEDDASIQYGASGMTNLKLLQAVRENCPNDYIVYKPHPDVLVGNRVGQIATADAMAYCDQIVTEVSIDSVLEQAEEVHTLTSLVGFEALMRGKKVVTYGMPFYAGWGLTHDQKVFESRTRSLSLAELVAGTLLLYPRYIDPRTLALCDIELVFSGLEAQREQLKNSLPLRVRLKTRNAIFRTAQRVIRKFY